MHLTVAAILSLLCLSAASPLGTRQSAPDPDSFCPYRPHTAAWCEGAAYNASATRQFVCGDSRLGPRILPSRRDGQLLDAMVENYDRFGGLCPGAFLASWWNASASRPGWIWPAQDGFSLTSLEQQASAPQPIKGNLQLDVGLLIDRFGGESGTFASPAGSPYMQRALPPNSMNTYPGDEAHPFNFHVYRVTRAFLVSAGPIAPWFGQPGQGVQYQLASPLQKLIEDGFLERVDALDLDQD